MITYEDYMSYKVADEIEYIKDLIGMEQFHGSPIESATDEQIDEIAEKVVYGLIDNDYLNMVRNECEMDEIYYQIAEMFKNSQKVTVMKLD